MSASPVITLANVARRFPAGAALQDVSLEIAGGEFVSIVGPSGCGKSTLLRLIAGLDQATAGQVDAGGDRPAFVFQEPNLLPWRNVVANVRLPLELAGTPRDVQHARINESLQLVGLEASDRGKFPAMLSGGMKMRVSLARALVTHPNVLLLDEPFAALDDVLRSRLNEELLAIWSRQQWTTLFVTHNVAEAVFLSQRVLVMSARPGRIVEQIDVPFDYPRSPELRAQAEFAALAGRVAATLREIAA